MKLITCDRFHATGFLCVWPACLSLSGQWSALQSSFFSLQWHPDRGSSYVCLALGFTCSTTTVWCVISHKNLLTLYRFLGSIINLVHVAASLLICHQALLLSL
jgi:hypothetical protein